MLLIVDNRDSFTYNIIDTLRKIGFRDYIVRNNPTEAEIIQSKKIIFSPGPGLPEDFPIMFKILEKFGHKKPIMGICLGFQAIAQFFGSQLYRLPFPVHGQNQQIRLKETSKMFKSCPSSFTVGLYHSWAVEIKSLPEELKITAISENNILMAVEHKKLPIFGVQFHPESYISQCGKQIFKNFISL